MARPDTSIPVMSDPVQQAAVKHTQAIAAWQAACVAVQEAELAAEKARVHVKTTRSNAELAHQEFMRVVGVKP